MTLKNIRELAAHLEERAREFEQFAGIEEEVFHFTQGAVKQRERAQYYAAHAVLLRELADGLEAALISVNKLQLGL